jgi:nucleotide-binding universal stress UspA family protein
VVVLTKVIEGPAPQTIMACAVEANRALVVMGTHGHTGLRRTVVGSVTAEVVIETVVPVLMVPPAGRTGSRRRPGRWGAGGQTMR